MSRYMTKNVSEYRIDSIEEVKAFEKYLRKRAAEKGYQIASYGWTEKFVKAKGEIIDQYYTVKAQEVFNDPKEPDMNVEGMDIIYGSGDNFTSEDFQDAVLNSEEVF